MNEAEPILQEQDWFGPNLPWVIESRPKGGWTTSGPSHAHHAKIAYAVAGVKGLRSTYHEYSTLSGSFRLQVDLREVVRALALGQACLSEDC